MPAPDTTKGWQRVGSILKLIAHLAAEQDDAPPAILEHVTGLSHLGDVLKKNRFKVSKQITDSSLAVLEATISCIVEIYMKWRSEGFPPHSLIRHVAADWTRRLAAILTPMGIQYKLPYGDFLEAVPDPDYRCTEREIGLSQREAHKDLQLRRSNIRITGSLLGVDENGSWQMYEGFYMDRAVAVKAFLNTSGAERSFRSELATHLRLSYHPNTPNLIGWAHSKAPNQHPSPAPSPRSSASASPYGTIPLSTPLHDDTYDDDYLSKVPEGPLLIFEHLDGPLDDVLPDRGFGKDSHRIIIGQVLKAVLHLHTAVPRSLVHGLINGTNVLIGADGRCMVTGISTCQTADDPAGPQKLLSDAHCNPCYQAPELLLATGKMLPSADVFAVGCLIFKLLTGEDPPLDPEHLPGYLEDARLPSFWYSLIVRCTAEDPADRPTAAELLTIIENTPSLPSTKLPTGPDSDSESSSTTPVKSEKQIRRDIGNELSLLGCSTTECDTSESDDTTTDCGFVRMPLAAEHVPEVDNKLLGFGTEPLIKRVPLEREDDTHLYFPSGKNSIDEEWVLERKERLLEIERLRAEIKNIDEGRVVRPFGFRQHVAEKISMTQFRNACDMDTTEAAALLRENGGRYKGTAYGELSMGLWCAKSKGDPKMVEDHYKKAVALAQDNDAEPLCRLGEYYMNQYKTKVTQENLNCTVLCLNDGVIRLSHPDMLPTVGSSVVLPALTGDVVWKVAGVMHGGVKLVTDEELPERRRVGGRFRCEDDVEAKQWAEAEKGDILWKKGRAEIGLEMKDCGTWVELESEEFKDAPMKQKLQEAANLLQTAASIDPTHLPSMVSLCESQKLQKQWGEAVKTLQLALKYHPKSAVLHAKLADILHHHFPNEGNVAEQHYRSAILHNGDGIPAQANLHGNLAIFLVHKGAKRAALEAFRSALALDGDHKNNLYNAGMFFKILGAPVASTPSVDNAQEARRKEPVLAAVGLRLLKHAASLGHVPSQLEAETLEAEIKKRHPRYTALEGPPIIPPDIDHLVHHHVPKDIPKGYIRPVRSSSVSSAATRSKSLLGLRRM